MKKSFNINWSVLGVIFTVVACGSTTPDIEQSYCPDDSETDSQTVASTSVVSSTTGGLGGAGGQTSQETSVVGAGGSSMNYPDYEEPQLDEIASRLHSCHKVTYSQLGNLLRNRGVAVPIGNITDTKNTQVSVFGMNQTLSNVFGGSGAVCEMAITTANGTNDPVCLPNETCFCNQDDKSGQVNRSCLDVGNNSPDAADGFCVAKPATAGYLYFTGKDALGYPKLDSRLGEKEEHSTASAMRLMDIFIQAAPQIIANISDPAKAPACTLNGKNLPMFASDGSCVEESVTCLIGMPATEDHMLLCNLLLQKANKNDPTDVMKKRNMAVALLLSAAHSCQ